jgi:ABC-type polysaccharide/polyol phosphate export permease
VSRGAVPGPGGSLLRHRALLATLTARELKGRYRGSLLGFFWSLVQPLLLLLVYSFVFGHVFQPRVPGAEPYPLFLVAGMFPWIWFSTSLSDGTISLTTNANLIRRSIFPIELLPGVAVLANMIHFLLALPVVAAGLAWSRFEGFDVGGWGLVAVPLVVLVEVPLVAGCALGLATLHAHFKDVRDLLTSGLMLLMFLTPIFYPLEAVQIPALRWVVRLAPTTPFTLAYQQAIVAGRFPDATLWLQMVVVSLVAWAVGSFVFTRLRDTLVEAL